MSISDDQFKAWLLRDSRRAVTLVEMDTRVEDDGEPAIETMYLSNRPYVDETAVRAYDDCVLAVPTYSRSLVGASLNSYQVSFGTMRLANHGGDLDWLIGSACDGSEIRFYYGDESWPIEDFRLMFSCMVQKIEAGGGNTMSELIVSFKDTSLLLNKSIGGNLKIGGDGPNADRWRPDGFGYIHQAECIAWDDASLSYVFLESGDYVVNDGNFSQTVRDGGDPIDYVDNGDGSISLLNAPVFQITTDILISPDGNPAHRCVSDALAYFIGIRGGLDDLGKYAGPGDTYDARPDSGVDAWVDAGGEDYLVGVYVPERRNLIDLVNEITDSGNCFWACDRLGNIFLGRLRPLDPDALGVTPHRAIVEDDIDPGTLRITHALPTYYKLQCRAARNWTIISQLADILTPEERDYLTRKGLEKIQDNFVGDSYDANPQLYHLSMAESPTIDTLLSSGNGADAIEIGRMDLWMGVRRGMTLPWIEAVALRTGLDRYDHELGSLVPIDFSKTGREAFDPPRMTQVLGVDMDLTAGKCALRLQLRRKLTVSETEEIPTTPVEDPQPPGLRGSALQVCSLNPMPCILTNGPPMFCPLEINCGAPEEDPGECEIDCGGGWDVVEAIAAQYLDPFDGVTERAPQQNLPSASSFAWAWDTWVHIKPGSGMDLCVENASDVTWKYTTFGFGDDVTEWDVGSGPAIVLMEPYATTFLAPWGGGGTDAIADGWELYISMGNTNPSDPPPYFYTEAPDASWPKGVGYGIQLQAYVGVVPACAPINLVVDDDIPAEP